jgi:UDP-N-acetylmuramoyl-tripeptide--D-alanyl-D-alanine ligase
MTPGTAAWTLANLAEASGGSLVRGDGARTVDRVSTDSRQVQPGDLFVALSGERFDGHAYVADAVRRGAVGVVVAAGREPSGELPVAVVRVPDPRRALGQLAAWHRSGLGLTLVAVGGSNGKTTTKEWLGMILGQKYRTAVSAASYNNDVGVPLTLLGLDRAHEVAVVEVGTNHPGELAPLVRMAAPRHGVITSLGREHLEFFGDLDGVLSEQSALGEQLPANGFLIVAGDDPGADRLANRTRARVVRVGVGPGNDWRITKVTMEEAGMGFVVETRESGMAGPYRVNLVGRHQVRNVVLAMAVASELGLDRAAVERGLAECRTVPHRMDLWSAGGIRVLDDSYNANADSVVAALTALSELPCEGRRLAVLGEMAELGEATEAAHREVGRQAGELGVEQLIAVGRMAGVLAEAARGAGLHRVMELGTAEAAAHAVPRMVRRGDLVLVKASRVAGLERVSEALRRGVGRGS